MITMVLFAPPAKLVLCNARALLGRGKLDASHSWDGARLIKLLGNNGLVSGDDACIIYDNGLDESHLSSTKFAAMWHELASQTDASGTGWRLQEVSHCMRDGHVWSRTYNLPQHEVVRTVNVMDSELFGSFKSPLAAWATALQPFGLVFSNMTTKKYRRPDQLFTAARLRQRSDAQQIINQVDIIHRGTNGDTFDTHTVSITSESEE